MTKQETRQLRESIGLLDTRIDELRNEYRSTKSPMLRKHIASMGKQTIELRDRLVLIAR